MNRCPLFKKCGGCKFDFTSDDYRELKKSLLKKIPYTNDPIWIEAGKRRRATFAFLDNVFGFFESGSKNVIPVNNCPALTNGLNTILPDIAKLPWAGSGSVLITECENGIDISVMSVAPYFTPEFKKSIDKISVIRFIWNDKIIKQIEQPVVKFGDVSVDYNPKSFLQPSKSGEDTLRNLVNQAAVGSKKIADLFCGLGSFTFGFNADGFDVAGGIHRDLFKKPLMAKNLKKYDCVIMDPPRAGAMKQSKELAKSDVNKIIYVSCNLDTFMRDKKILENGGVQLIDLTPVDQFVGSDHWEIVSVFKK